ncbi:biotin-independent malonate decarboxylase subunit beta [Geomicrobium sp. JSM 1781026]|uniref:biotin-independent malonate decarboxylase subunit beta n=1 Tax=Geomicrobium sp. JSM 1781026 TaxID=3344580 RepID=UPI0035C265D9
MKITIPQSLAESSARDKAFALLDQNSAYELLGPFDRLRSPHLEKQNIVPQNDDGVIVMKGTRNNYPTCVVSIEGNFQGGGIGEVSGAKIAAALELALSDLKNGKELDVVIILDTGGVRLQEANYGLLAIAEIQQVAVQLQEYTPIIGIIPGRIGSFGGMSITAGLFNALIMTKEARLGLNGPEVIEQEAGITEVNSSDRKATYLRIGSHSRKQQTLIEFLVDDAVDAIQKAIDEARGMTENARVTNNKENLYHLLRCDVTSKSSSEQNNPSIDSRGLTWLEQLADIGSVQSTNVPTIQIGQVTLDEPVHVLSITKDNTHRFPRVRNGEFGLLEGYAIADVIDQWIEADANRERKTPIIAIVDVVSQAYGHQEEALGLHQSCAAAVHAYARARLHGHKIVALVVGKALSAAFLSHGLQADRIVAFDDPYVQVHVMSKQSAAKVTRRSLSELERFTKDVPAMAYDIQSFHSLGATDSLINSINFDQPSEKDAEQVKDQLLHQLQSIKNEQKHHLSHHRLRNERAKQTRAASIIIREEMAKQWHIEGRNNDGRTK